MRRPARPRGFTLVETLIAIVIFGITSAALYGLLTRTQRLARSQAERSMLQANIRTGVGLVTSELRELNATATTTDIYAMSPTAIEYKGMRATGFVCATATDHVRVLRTDWLGFRDPIAGRDGVLLFVEHDPGIASDDGWLERDISAVATATCTVAGSSLPAWRLDFATALPPDTAAMLTLGSPLRTFERMQIGQISAGGESWLGARSVSAGETGLQPVLGPLAANGVRFTYWTGAANGSAQATVPGDVRTVRLVLRGITETIVAAGAGTTPWQRATDSLVTDIRLRNAP